MKMMQRMMGTLSRNIPEHQRLEEIFGLKHRFHKSLVPISISALLVLVVQLTAFDGWCDLTRAPEADAEVGELLDLSLEDILDLEVTSASLKTQRLMDVASAVYVISSEDILRSGASSLPEMLRMVPGLNVFQIDTNKWGVSARGFNGRYSRKLLVLIDGRSIYNPTFSGVYWDAQDIIPEDIDRIEVIRGPGATIWGSNAMNGVINIITKTAQQTQGGLLKVGMGTERLASGALRYGGMLGENFSYRLHGNGFEEDSGVAFGTSEDSWDHWANGRVGFRLDGTVGSSEDTLTIQGEYSENRNHTNVLAASLATLTTSRENDTEDVHGAHLQVRWMRQFENGGTLTLQGYYDHYERDSTYWFIESVETWDVEAHHAFQIAQSHQLIWGLNFRWIDSTISPNETQFMSLTQSDLFFASLFVQDEITLMADRLFLTLGSKIEDNPYAGWDIQPSARLLWRLSSNHTVWGAVSRALRSPSSIETDGVLRAIVQSASMPVPSVLEIASDDGNFDTEKMIAYEMGYRGRLTDKVFMEANLFYNDYDDLFRLDYGDTALITIAAGTYLYVPTIISNGSSGHTHGLEVALEWEVNDWWRLIGGYGYLRMDLDDSVTEADLDVVADEQYAQNQLSLRSRMDLPHNVSLDLWYRFTDRIPGLDLSAFSSLDLHLSWKPLPDLEFSIIGKNLLDSQNMEFSDEYFSIQTVEIERSVFGQIKWEF
ncbi:MAG: TonB-dependent receptor [Magnetococcales bacterium]|nr:TonB-dependent receptor [Magnetococcales bacterium]